MDSPEYRSSDDLVSVTRRPSFPPVLIGIVRGGDSWALETLPCGQEQPLAHHTIDGKIEAHDDECKVELNAESVDLACASGKDETHSFESPH